MNILDEIHSWEIFAPLFKDPRTWHAWEGHLRGQFGLELERQTRASGLDNLLIVDTPDIRGWR